VVILKTGSKVAIVVIIVVIVVVAVLGVDLYVHPSSTSKGEVVVYADYGPTLAQKYFDAFTNDTGIKVVPVYGSMGDLVGKLVASKGSETADVLFGGAPSAYITAATQGVFQSYTPPSIANQSAYIGNHVLWRDPNWLWYPFTYAALGISVNTKLISNSSVPTSWYQLSQPQYKGEIVMENPTTSTTTGLGFFSLVAQWYMEKYGNTTGWTMFKSYVHGVLNNSVVPYQSDDENAEVAVGTGTGGITIDWTYIPTEYATQNGYPLVPHLMNNTILGPTAMALVNGAPHQSNAQAFINWVLSKQGQTEIGIVFDKPPIIPGVPIPAGSFSISQIEPIAFPYNQTWTADNANNITAVFNEYASS